MRDQTAEQATMELSACLQVISLGEVSNREQYLESSGTAENDDRQRPPGPARVREVARSSRRLRARVRQDQRSAAAQVRLVTTSPFSHELEKLATRSSVARHPIETIAFMTPAKRQCHTTRQAQRGRPVPASNALSAGKLPTTAT